MKEFENLEDAQTLALAIVDTIPEPFLVLDDSFSVMAASRSFYECLKVDAAQTRGRSLFALGDGQWGIPALRHLIAAIIPGRPAMEGFEVEHDFQAIGHKIMLLNARTVTHAGKDTANILLAFQDITLRRQIEQEKATLNAQTEHLLAQQRILFQEMQHRVANSLQIIASILTLKAGSVTSEEKRHHLEGARERVMSVAAVQTHLNASEGIDRIEVGAYLAKLGSGLSASMIGEGRPIVLDVVTDESIIASADAISLGLIVTELVINAIKYAFPMPRPDARILVQYEVQGSDWSLTVSDNGVGKTNDASPSKGGLGTAIVKALAKQLDARISSTSTPIGLSVAVTRATFVARIPQAA